MALVKFNKSANKQAAAAAISDNTVYFPTDEQAVYLNGRKMGEANTVFSVNGKTGKVTITASDIGLTDIVTSVNGKKGAVTLAKADIGLGNVDNTADAVKSVANAAASTNAVYATKIGSSSSHPQIGNATTPVYVDNTGAIVAGKAIGASGYKGVDTTISNSASNANLPTSSAVKAYVDSSIGGVTGDLVLVGTVNCNNQQVTPTSALYHPSDTDTFETFLNNQDAGIREGFVLVTENKGKLIAKSAKGTPGDEEYVPEISITVEAGEQIIITGSNQGSEIDYYWEFIAAQKNVDVATADTIGLVKVPSSNGLYIDSNGAIHLALANGSSDAGTDTAGAMSISDKNKLNNIEEGANKYVLPTASSSELGGIQIGFTNTDTLTNGRNSAVSLDGNKKAYVNIPYASGTTASNVSGGIVRPGISTDEGNIVEEGKIVGKTYPAKINSTTKRLYVEINLASSKSIGLLDVADKNKLNKINSDVTALPGVPASNQTPAFGETFSVGQVTTNSAGQVTAITSRTVTIPNTEVSTTAKGLMTSEMLDALTWH